jgi:adenine deaminase
MHNSAHATRAFLRGLPKAELHVHLEGTIEPELYLKLALRNQIDAAPQTIEQAQVAYNFHDFDSFIAAYKRITFALCTEQDFYDVMWAYLEKIHEQGVTHIEVFFDIQTYTPRGIEPAAIINGLYAALADGYTKWGISGFLIMCILRNLSEESAYAALKSIEPCKDKICGIGLAGTEKNNPPEKFIGVFKQARNQGYRLTAHAGECVADNIRGLITELQVERIDHGVHASENQALMEYLKEHKIPLTLCPQSNIMLGIYKNKTEHPLPILYKNGLIVTINSDDPAFFRASLLDNYMVAQQIGLSQQDLIICAQNSFKASFLSEFQKEQKLRELLLYLADYA